MAADNNGGAGWGAGEEYPVVCSPIRLRAPYAMFGTELAYVPTRRLDVRDGEVDDRLLYYDEEVRRPYRISYARSTNAWYCFWARGTNDLVLTGRMRIGGDARERSREADPENPGTMRDLLRGCYALSGTDLAYDAMRCPMIKTAIFQDGDLPTPRAS
eukprot:1267720-Rhodomonas_salina.2